MIDIFARARVFALREQEARDAVKGRADNSSRDRALQSELAGVPSGAFDLPLGGGQIDPRDPITRECYEAIEQLAKEAADLASFFSVQIMIRFSLVRR